MNKQEDIARCLESIKILCRSSANYVHKRIANPTSQKAYELSMKACLSVIDDNWHNFDIIRAKISAVSELADDLYVKNIFKSYADERRYHNLAVDQCLDIINNLQTRFITGYYYSDLTDLKKGEDSYENKSVF